MTRLGRITIVSCAVIAAVPAGCDLDDKGTTGAQPTTISRPGTIAPATTAPAPQQRTPPPARPFSWRAAGALVWHETDVDPRVLGRALRQNGFGWVALFLHDGLAEDPVDRGWIDRFRDASGLPLGGWGVLRTDPEREAELADTLLTRYRLGFYIADAESEYQFSGAGGPSDERARRSGRFVTAFRARRPHLAAALTSYCRADRQDLDWRSWRNAGFVLLPQAYVNVLGAQAAPAVCVAGAARFFPREEVHPLIGLFVGARPFSSEQYVHMLAHAGTEGFSVYPAEIVSEEQWRVLGRGIAERSLAR